jgi:hypothetical protein
MLHRLLVVGLGAVLIAACGLGGDSGVSTTSNHDEIGQWLTSVEKPSSHWDLFFGALGISDDIFFRDPEGALCFNTALARELVSAGPEPVITTLDQWTATGKAPGPSWNDLVELLNSVSYEDRVRIGEAAATAIEECGGLRERVLRQHGGPTLTSCYIEFYDRHDAMPMIVAASLEMNTNATAEFGPESEAAFGSLPWEGDTRLAPCYEGLEAARAEYEATREEQPSPMDSCDPTLGYGYLKVDQEWYMSARTVNQEPELAYHARVWGERETWLSDAGDGRNHQVTQGPGFDSIDTTDAWLQMGAPEPLEMGIVTFDVGLEPGDVRVLDLECLASIRRE